MKKLFRKLLISLPLLAVLGAVCTGGGMDLKIYAVKYGTSLFQKKFVFYGDKSGGTVPFSWMFYYVEYGDKKILIDTGFNDPKMVKLFSITDFREPAAILRENGISPEQITDVIITHSHFDHIGNVSLFKNAAVIINRDELAGLNKNKSLSSINQFISSSPKVTVFDESTVLYNKFTVKKIGGHTKGSSAVFFSEGNRSYCFTGDEIYLKENVSQLTGNGSAVNHRNNMNFIEQLGSDKSSLFIFHDNKFYDSKKSFIKVFPED